MGRYGSPFVNEGRVAMSVEKLVEHFSALEDPRCSGKVDHRLIDILVIAVCAVIACAESWDDIALYGRNKLSWLRSFLSLANGIPSHDTFRRVFMLIDPDAFEACFSAWAQSFAEAFDREVVAIDGKTLRRSLRPRPGAGAAASGQCLGQRAGAGARPARGRRQIERDHRDPGTARDAGAEEQHRDPGRHGLPEDNRRPDPGARRRLPAGAQGESRKGIHRGAGIL